MESVGARGGGAGGARQGPAPVTAMAPPRPRLPCCSNRSENSLCSKAVLSRFNR